MNQIKNTITNSIWKSNSVLKQLLGMCPMLAVTSTAINALGLGLVTTIVLIITNIFISVLCRWIPSEIRIPIYITIIASIVSVVQMLIHAYVFSLYQSLGIFIPLIVTNCIVLGRAEMFAAKNHPFISALDGLITGIKITGTMFILGSIREILGKGTLFDGIDMLLGSYTELMHIKLYHINTPFLLAMLPPSAFIGLGMMLAVKFFLKGQLYNMYKTYKKYIKKYQKKYHE